MIMITIVVIVISS